MIIEKVRHVTTRIPNPSYYKIFSFIIVKYITYEKMWNLKFQSQTDRHHRLWCVFQNNNITSNIFVTRAASDRQFLKNKNDKSKLRKYLTKNYSSLNQSHDGWLQNTLMILIIDDAIFFWPADLCCRYFLCTRAFLFLDCYVFTKYFFHFPPFALLN